MYTHYQSNKLTILWTLFRGVSHTKENFSGAKVVAFVFSKTGKWFVTCSEADGALTLTLPENMPVGIYSLEAVWTKNHERSVSRAIYDDAFAVTDIASEATFRGGSPDPEPLALHSSAGSFGYDGLSAYELAVMKGMTTKSENEWVASAVITAEAEEGRTFAESARASAELARAAAEADRANSFADLQRSMQVAIGHNLESMEQTVASDVSGGVNIITATMLDGTSTTFEVKNGQQGAPGPKGEKGDKGDQGNSGYTGATGELEVINNLSDGGPSKALSAEMGKVLKQQIDSTLADDLSKMKSDMSSLFVTSSTEDSTDLLGVTTSLRNLPAAGRMFFYEPCFREDVYIDSIILPANYSGTAFRIGYGDYSIDDESHEVTVTGKVLAEITDITVENGVKVAHIGGLRFPKGKYLAASKLTYNTQIYVNPSGGNAAISFAENADVGDVSLTRLANYLMTPGFHIVYRRIPSADSIIERVEDLENGQNKYISILFFGNSLTTDAMAYVPWMLKTLAPTLKFRIVNFYRGGKTVAQQLAFLNDPSHSDTSGGFKVRISISESPAWSDVTSSWESVLAEGFNHITIQEYTNNKASFDYTNYPLLIEKLRSICGTSAKFHHFMDKTLNGDAVRYARAEEFAHIAYSTQAVDSIVNPGTAFKLAWENATLHTLITSDSTYSDSEHAEEGLPCYVEALVLTRWVFEQLGLQTSILNDDLILDSTIYAAMGDHGANVGTNGPIYGSAAEQLLGQEIAQTAWNQRKRIELGLSNT